MFDRKKITLLLTVQEFLVGQIKNRPPNYKNSTIKLYDL